MDDIHPVALFRYSVLGPLVSRAQLQRGELKTIIRELAARDYDIPGSSNSRIDEKTIEAWYYAWLLRLKLIGLQKDQESQII